MRRINLYELTGGRAVTVYAQHEVLKDLIARRLEDGGDVRFGVERHRAWTGVTGDRPTIRFTHEGQQQELECDFVVGCDGSRTYTRYLIPEGEIRTDFFRQYPFAWFGILAEAPPSSDELIYAHSERGFALISTRSPTVQRLYFQCDPETDRRRLVRRPDLGGAAGAGGRRRGDDQDRADLPEGRSCSSAASSASRCSTAGCSWPATPRTPSRPPAPRA